MEKVVKVMETIPILGVIKLHVETSGNFSNENLTLCRKDDNRDIS